MTRTSAGTSDVALIGDTGFVGGNLREHWTFDATYNSRTIGGIAGRHFRLLVCAGARAEKWWANQHPEEDRAGIARLRDALARVQADRVVLISTVDVYPVPRGVDEDAPIDPGQASAYGRHRLELERFVADRFASCIVRLPGLFGPGLKKNVIYDLLHDNQVDRIDPRGRFQFYDLQWLPGDLDRALEHDLTLLNVTSPPIAAGEIAQRCFDRHLPEPREGTPASYDVRSRHADLWRGRDGYLYDRETVFEAMTRFIGAARTAT